MNLFRGTSKFVQFVLIATLFFLGSRTTLSQAEESEGKSLCWRGQPLPKCKSFLITEFGIYYRLARTPKPSVSANKNHWWLAGDLGWMKNISPKYAVGGTFFVGANPEDDLWRLGIRAKVRHWLRPNLSFDFAPGVMVGMHNEDNQVGFSGHLGLNLGDWVSAVTQVDVIPVKAYYPSRRATEVAWYGGLKLGSSPAAIAIAVGSVVGALIAGSFAQ